VISRSKHKTQHSPTGYSWAGGHSTIDPQTLQHLPSSSDIKQCWLLEWNNIESSNKFKFMPELIPAFMAWNNHDYRHSLKNAWYSIAGISPSNFQGFLIYLTVAMYPGRSDPGESPGICAMIFTNMFLSIILSNRSKLSSQEAWWLAPGRPYDWYQRKPWQVRTTIDEIVWMIKKIMSNPNPINFSHQKYPQKWSQIYLW